MSKIKNLLLLHRNKLVLTLSVFLLILLTVDFYFVYDVMPSSNDECLWTDKVNANKEVEIYIEFVKYEGVAWNAGIRDGDRLLAINSINVNTGMDAMEILNKIERGGIAEYTIERDGQIFTKNVKIKKLLNFQGLGVIFFSIIWLIVGTLVLLGKNTGKVQILFYKIGVYFSFFSCFYFLWGTMSLNPTFKYPILRLVIDLVWSLGATLLPFVWVKFFLFFPKESDFVKNKKFIKYYNLVPLVLYVYTLVVRFGFIYFSPGQNNIYIAFVANPLLVLVVSSMILGLVLLFRNYLKLESKKERNSIFIILVSYAIGVAAIIYFVTFSANTTEVAQFNSPEYFMPIIIIGIVPISFAYSIFKYSLMDMSDVFKNTIIYGTATLSLASAYFFVIYVIGFLISNAIGTQYQGIIAGIIFILFALLFQSTKDKFQELITQKIYPEQFAFRKVLLKFSNEISEVVGLENILNFTNSTFIDSLKLSHFGILLWNDKTKKYEYHIGCGINNNLTLRCVDFSVSRFLKEKELIKAQPVIEKTDFEKVFPLDYNLLMKESIYSIIPLRSKNKIVGLLLFGLKYSGAQFAGSDFELLIAAANQIAMFIENARLYNVELENTKLEKEIDNARKIQESLLPKRIPLIKSLDISGKMIPAMHVGGDYYDVIKVSNSKTFVIVGDVSGKGFSASFYMSKLQTMVRLFCTENRTPKDILVELNKLVYEAIDKHSFITVSLALFDSEEKTVKICRAGHPPILAVNNYNYQVYQPQGIGVGLEKGNVFDSTIEEVTISLYKDDVFIFYSDGISEAMNLNNELYGFDNLKNTIKLHSAESAYHIQSAIINSINFFRNGAHQNDDITIVVVKVTE